MCGRVAHATLAAFFAGLALFPAGSTLAQCAARRALPAYSHNDYRAARPLTDAVRYGLRGVEVDLFLEDRELRVGHDRRDLVPGRTLEQLYLDPLAERASTCGFIVSPERPFLLNVELKEVDPAAFGQLLATLQRYEESLFLPRRVDVVLVGWWPTPPQIGQSWPPYLGVQLPWEDDHARVRARAGDRIRLLSVDYSKSLRWSGRGRPPSRAGQRLDDALATARALGVSLRVHQAPIKPSIFRWILDHGVDLIGIKDLGSGVACLPSNLETQTEATP